MENPPMFSLSEWDVTRAEEKSCIDIYKKHKLVCAVFRHDDDDDMYNICILISLMTTADAPFSTLLWGLAWIPCVTGIRADFTVKYLYSQNYIFY